MPGRITSMVRPPVSTTRMLLSIMRQISAIKASRSRRQSANSRSDRQQGGLGCQVAVTLTGIRPLDEPISARCAVIGAAVAIAHL